MSMIDNDGKLFGRINLVDAAVIAFVALLIPIGYATFLLFRPDRPSIESVTRVELTNEERRVSGGTVLTAKLKVTGSGFNPLLRARIDDIDAVGLVFENPNSLDVIVGVVPPGKHDLVLYDGVQEVARARGAVETQSAEGPSVRAYGWLTDLPESLAASIQPGYGSDPAVPGAFKIVATGPVQPARARVAVGAATADLPLPGKHERAVEAVIRCGWPSTQTCTINGQRLTQLPPIIVGLPGGFRLEIEEIAPSNEPAAAVARLRVASTAGVKVGDRDSTVGSRAAVVTSIDGNTVTMKLGVHESREGYRYRGGLVVPGSTLNFHTNSYALSGTVISVDVTRP
jgi:hypothetical protein